MKIELDGIHTRPYLEYTPPPSILSVLNSWSEETLLAFLFGGEWRCVEEVCICCVCFGLRGRQDFSFLCIIQLRSFYLLFLAGGFGNAIGC